MTVQLSSLRCDPLKRRPSYGWRRVRLLDGSRAIGREKKEGRNYYGGVWYRFYISLPNKQTGLRFGRAVLQLHPALDLLHHGTVCSCVWIP